MKGGRQNVNKLVHRVFGVVVDRPEAVAARRVVGPSTGNAFVARRLGPGLAVGAVIDAVVVHVGKSPAQM